MKRTSIHKIEGTVVCVSGLRIGGTEDQLEIGGLDLPVIKHPETKQPYIPGSSLKGRMRSELEHQLGRYSGGNKNEPCNCARTDCPVCCVFGPHKYKPPRGRNDPIRHPGPTRLLVRDAQPVGPAPLEIKTENVIDHLGSGGS